MERESGAATRTVARAIGELFALVEARTGWNLADPKATLEIVRECGTFRVYGRGRLLVPTMDAGERHD